MSIFGSKKGLKILFVGTEVSPFAKVGGLSSVAHSLPNALNRLGHDARVMIPRYLFIEDQKYDLGMEFNNLKVPTGLSDGEDGPKENPNIWYLSRQSDPRSCDGWINLQTQIWSP